MSLSAVRSRINVWGVWGGLGVAWDHSQGGPLCKAKHEKEALMAAALNRTGFFQTAIKLLELAKQKH